MALSAEEKQKRIGVRNPDGTKRWPELNIHGNRYDKRRCSQKGIGRGKFVVVPPGFNQWHLVDEYFLAAAKGSKSDE